MVAKGDSRPISSQSLRVLSNALCLVQKLLITFTGHAKFAAVSISHGYLRRFAELHDEYVLTWIEYSYVAIPTLQLFNTHLVEARNSAQRVTFTHRVSNRILGNGLARAG